MIEYPFNMRYPTVFSFPRVEKRTYSHGILLYFQPGHYQFGHIPVDVQRL